VEKVFIKLMQFIDFDQNLKRKILEWFKYLMVIDGFLYLSRTETALGVTGRFKLVSDNCSAYMLSNNNMFIQ